MELMECRDGIVSMVQSIKSLINIDLVVVDRWLLTVVNTFEYQHPSGDMRLNSIVGNIIVTNEPQIIKNRSQSKICSACHDYSNCELEYIVGVPIRREDECVGVVAALLRINQGALLNDNGIQLQTFLTQLATNFSVLLESKSLRRQLNSVNTQMLDRFDDLSDLIVLTDESGKIRFTNRSFNQSFSRHPDELLGTPLRELLQTTSSTEREHIQLQPGGLFPCVDGTLANLVSISPVSFFPGEIQRLYVFKPLKSLEFLNPYVGYEQESRFQKFWATSEAMQRARQAALSATRNNLPVLIMSNSTTRSRELVKMLSQMTPGTSHISSIVNCTIESDELEMILFGDAEGRPGLIQPPRNCCVGLSNIHCMPLYLQARLAEFLDKRQYQGESNGRVSVYTTTTVDLDQYTAKGHFSRDLLNLISTNRIVIPPIWNDMQDAKFYFSRFLQEFSKKYQLDEELDVETYWSNLLASGNHPEYLELWSLAERLVASIKNNQNPSVPTAILPAVNEEFSTEISQVSIEKRLQLLLASEKNKSKIAKILGVSRATLYRWIERYDLSQY